MQSSFHESFDRAEKVEGSSDRGFGLTVGGILVAIAVIRTGLAMWRGGAGGWVEIGLGAVGVALFAFGLIAPALLAPLNRAWTKLGLILPARISSRGCCSPSTIRVTPQAPSSRRRSRKRRC